jgi:hypothetical protein
MAGKLDQLGLDPLALQFPEHMPEKQRRVAVLPRTAIECHNLHAECPPRLF